MDGVFCLWELSMLLLVILNTIVFFTVSTSNNYPFHIFSGVIWLLEVILKLFAYGWRLYVKHRMNLIDFFSTLAWLVSLGASWTGYGLIVRSVRLFRLLNLTATSRSIAHTLSKITPPALSFMSMLMILWYLFAIVGIEAWHGKLSPAYLSPTSAFAQAGYWPFNFDSIGNAFVVLFNLWVVNNWYVIMDAVVEATGQEITRLYFILFYFICVSIATNIIVAFVMEASVKQFELAILHHTGTQRIGRKEDEIHLSRLLSRENVHVRVERHASDDIIGAVLGIEA